MIWQPCSSSPDVVAFVVFLWAARVLAWTPCQDIAGMCPVYQRGPWVEMATFAVEDVCDAEGCELGVPQPPVDGVDWWRIESKDLAGNVSEGTCP